MRSRQRPTDLTIQLNWKTKAYPTIRRCVSFPERPPCSPAERYIRTNSVRFVCNGALRFLLQRFEGRRAVKPRLRKAHCRPRKPASWTISSSNCGAIATLSRLLHSATLRVGFLGRIANLFDELGAIMTIAGLTSSDQTTAIKAAFAANDVRTLI